jgi:hypothetical protein
MDDETIKQSAKAARAVAKTTGKAIDAGREVGRFLNKIFGRAIVNTVGLYWTDRVIARRIEAAIFDWKRLQELFANADSELSRKGTRTIRALAPKVLLGHAKLDSTALYTRVATKTIQRVTSPLEHIAVKLKEMRPPS